MGRGVFNSSDTCLSLLILYEGYLHAHPTSPAPFLCLQSTCLCCISQDLLSARDLSSEIPACCSFFLSPSGLHALGVLNSDVYSLALGCLFGEGSLWLHNGAGVNEYTNVLCNAGE